MAHGDDSLAGQCQTAAGHAEDGGHHEHGQTAPAPRCCCDYVACTAAAIVGPAVAVGTAAYSAVRYRAPATQHLGVRALLLDTDPPRPAALS